MSKKDEQKSLTINTPLPYCAEEFLIYMESIKGKSENTVREYRYDLISFFSFFAENENVKYIDELDDDFLRKIRLADLYRYINHLSKDLKLAATSRARKVASLRSFFKYLHSKAHIIDTNPAIDLESPKLTKKLPMYLKLDESRRLLSSVKGENEARDYCILTLFLNCGMRLSELCGINITSIKDNTVVVRGKGDKERTIYLNEACENAITDYLRVRTVLPENDPDADALFLSERKKRISRRAVQYTVKKYLTAAGIDPEKYSTHKLRHTAATLMYQYGDVDIRSLQEILGHESISTTEIYTHVNSEKLAEAVRANPLAGESKSHNVKDESDNG